MENLLSSLEPADWLALVFFFFSWIGYTLFSRRRSKCHNSLNSMLDLYRRDWMYQVFRRENRIHDVTLVGVFERNCAFFASSALLILAGLLSLLGYSPEAVSVFTELHFSLTVSKFVIITLVLACIFVYTFFVFTWSMRQFGFVGIMIVSAPLSDPRHYTKQERKTFALHCAKVADLASMHFNYGLRAYYFAIAVLGWYIDPLMFISTTTIVVIILFQREFASRSVYALQQAHKDIDVQVSKFEEP